MIGILKTIKKKRHKRRVCFLWLFLVVIELLCPVLSDEGIFAAKPYNSPETQINLVNGFSSTSVSPEISAAQNQNRHVNKTVCNDECFCHTTAIVNIENASIKVPIVYTERIAFNFGEFVHRSLPPPYHPPKLS